MVQDLISAGVFVLRFECLAHGMGYAFPCDPSGQVDLNRLGEAARNNYLYARAMVGREFAPPAVQPQRPSGLAADDLFHRGALASA